MVTKVGHVLLTSRFCSAVGVRRSHVSGEETQDVAQCHLVAVHVLFSLGAGDVGKMWVSPSMRCDLVAFSVSTLDGSSPGIGSVIDLSLAIVVAGDEEGGLGRVLL